MSKGISWMQRSILESVAASDDVVAWRDAPYRARLEGRDEDGYFSRRVVWNHEQSLRRALRSLAKRGLVECGRYVFTEDNKKAGFFHSTLSATFPAKRGL